MDKFFQWMNSLQIYLLNSLENVKACYLYLKGYYLKIIL